VPATGAGGSGGVPVAPALFLLLGGGILLATSRRFRRAR
jgi:hypothetical protein